MKLKFFLGLVILGLNSAAGAIEIRPLANTSSVSLHFKAQVFVRAESSALAGQNFDTSYALTRARLKFSLRHGQYLRADVQPDFAGARADLADVFIGVKPTSFLNFTLGQAKTPFGVLESIGRFKMPVVDRGLLNEIVSQRLGFSIRKIGGLISLGQKSFSHLPKLEAGVYGEEDGALHQAARLSFTPWQRWTLQLAGFRQQGAASDQGHGQVGALSFGRTRGRLFLILEGQMGRARLLTKLGTDAGHDSSFIAGRALFARRFQIHETVEIQPFLGLELFDPNFRTRDDLNLSGRTGLNMFWLKTLRLSGELSHRSSAAGAVLEKETRVIVFAGVNME